MRAPAVVQRRQFLRFAGLAPWVISGTSLSGSFVHAANAPKVVRVKFNGMAAPDSVADRAAVYTAASVDVTRSDGLQQKALPLTFKTIYQTGDWLPHPIHGTPVLAGGYYLPDGLTPIMDNSGAKPEPFYSDCVDGQSLLKLPHAKVSGIQGNPVFLVTQFEYKSQNNAGALMYGQLPSPVAVVSLDQNTKTGELTAKSYFNIPTASVHGLWITCAGSLSPWGTHLSSEEYEPDAWTIASNVQFQNFCLHTFGSQAAGNPYHYGFVPEVTVHADGTGSIQKHYNMGRISRELVEVMPDLRTVLMGDDYTNGGMFMFIADKAKNLSSGTLYVAKLQQTNSAQAADGGNFVIDWIRLGHATSHEIESLANRCKATDIFDVKTVATEGYGAVTLDGAAVQYVKFHPGMEKAAAFLETHRYAGIMGGTMEFTKFEGVTLNIQDKVAYIAMSRLEKSMQDGAGDIQVKKVMAGGVYSVSLAGGKKDLGGAHIPSEWVPVRMSLPPALLGEDLAATDADGNTAAVDKIANPDNVKFSQSMRTLFIGEDSGMHLNNYVWAYNIDTQDLSRILSVPAGAECTGLQAVDNLNGFAYVMSAFQHAGDWKFTASQASLKLAVQNQWGLMKKSAVGYISGLPVVG